MCPSGLPIAYLKGRRKPETYKDPAQLILFCPLALFTVTLQYIQALLVQSVVFAKFLPDAQWRLNSCPLMTRKYGRMVSDCITEMNSFKMQSSPVGSPAQKLFQVYS